MHVDKKNLRGHVYRKDVKVRMYNAYYIKCYVSFKADDSERQPEEEKGKGRIAIAKSNTRESTCPRTHTAHAAQRDA